MQRENGDPWEEIASTISGPGSSIVSARVGKPWIDGGSKTCKCRQRCSGAVALLPVNRQAPSNLPKKTAIVTREDVSPLLKVRVAVYQAFESIAYTNGK